MNAQRENILNRWAAGETSMQIAAALRIIGDTADAYVRATVQRARKQGDGRAIARARGQHGEFIKLRVARAGAAGRRISAEAAKRGLTPHELASMILATVADNDLFKAVLDD